MAVEVFPDSPPRISFSHDLPQNDIVPVEHYIRSSPSDFNFCVFRTNESSSADDLFFDGKILPVQIKKKLAPVAAPPLQPQLPPPPQKATEEKQNYKSWFKRSTSLNCGSGYARTLCPLPPLLRSNSTGSTSSIKKQNFPKSSSLKQCSPTGHQKPPLKKSSHGVKITPVLNVPTAALFGFGFIFSGGKEKSRKK